MIVGVFPMAADFLHAGHVAALQQAAQQCDKLIVTTGIWGNKDKAKPVQTIAERYMMLRAIKWVDEVIPCETNEDMLTVLGCLDYQIRFVGSDYRDKDWTGKTMEEKRGIQPIFIERQWHNLSSSEFKDRLKKSCSKA